ncbi:MAG: ABC transporter permease [Stackebrandtia sp.]
MTDLPLGSAGYRPVSDSLVMTVRSLRHAVRNVDSLLIGAFLPVLVLLLMTTVFGGAIESEGFDYVDYVVPGVLLMCVGYGASLTATSVTGDMRQGIISRFRTMNLLPAAVIVGHVLASVLRNLLSVAMVIVTALLLGFDPSAGLTEWLGVAGVMAAFVLAVATLSSMYGLIARSVEGAAVPGFFFLFLPYVSSTFVPIETLPDWLQSFATYQPFTPLGETLRSLLMGTPMGDYGWQTAAWCVGLLVAGIVGTTVKWRGIRQ